MNLCLGGDLNPLSHSGNSNHLLSTCFVPANNNDHEQGCLRMRGHVQTTPRVTRRVQQSQQTVGIVVPATSDKAQGRIPNADGIRARPSWKGELHRER